MSSDLPRLLGGRYEVGELIGRGGMAEVHLGYDTRLGRQVAIKILRSDHLRDATFLGRFRREAQSVAGLSHPAVVAVYDSGEEFTTESGGADVAIPYIVMEYVDGQTLRDILGERGSLPPHEAARITEGVLGALDYSHRMGMVHRDIKPANVMIGHDGAVKVMDFGIARAVADTQATMTQTSSVMGTAQYISPEQAEGAKVDSRSDLYSTGVLLFELLTGRTPFVGEPVSLTYQHVTKPPPLPSSLSGAVPEELDAVVAHALVKDRELRYQDAESFRADLQAYRLGLPVSEAAMHSLRRLESARNGGEPEPAPVGTASDRGGPITAPVNDRYADDEPRSRRGVWLVAALFVAALAILGIAGKAYLDSRPKEAVVPVVTDLPLATAQARLKEDGFQVAASYEPNQNIERDHVIKQDPPGNTSQREGSLVSLVVSGGPAATQVPNVIGKNQQVAVALLQQSALQVGTVRKQNSPEAGGRVIGSDPKPFTSAHAGDVVNLVVSTGKVELPDLTGKTEDQARDILGKLNLDVTTTSQESSQTEGDVISQNPPPGLVSVGSTVALVIAKPIPVTQTYTVTTTPQTQTQTTSTSTDTQTGTGGPVTSNPPTGTSTEPRSGVVAAGRQSAELAPLVGLSPLLGLAGVVIWVHRRPRRH